MLDNFHNVHEHLPLVPAEVLRKHHCHEPTDTRFRSAARLLQALWREDRKLPLGSYKRPDGKIAKLGSRITANAGKVGGNFLSPEIAYFARRASIYREIGAVMDQERLLANLLSSMPLTFNLFGPLALDLKLATAVCHALVPGFNAQVKQILFEHSPGRGHAKFTSDWTAFDLLLRYTTPAGKFGFLAVEMKYSEGMVEPVPAMKPRYDELTRTTRLFIDPESPFLRANPMQQLWREHLLAQAMLDNELYDEGTFVLIAPRLNWHCQQAAGAYRCQLEEPKENQVGFLNLHLETVIEAIRNGGAIDIADRLHRRYCDWWLVDGQIELEVFGLKSTKPGPSPEARKKSRTVAKSDTVSA